MHAVGFAVLATALLLPASAVAQGTGGTRCNAVNTAETRQFMEKLPSGQYNTYMGGGVVVHCPAKQITLRADSMEQYGDEKRLYLVGHVYYREPRFNLHSDFLNYYMAEERIVATGNVDATMPSGSRLQGPVATYLRPIPKRRPLAQMSADQRPTITLVQLDSLGNPEPPMKVVANNVFMDGDSLVYAGGHVEITRQDVLAHSDSAFLDGQKEIMHLMRGPKIEGRSGTNPFTLVGVLIDLYSRDRQLYRVIARGKGVATSKDVILHADTIDMRVTNDLLERAMAWGPGRASAKSPVDSLLADSIEVLMPGQHVREIHAVAKAYAESKPDTAKFRTKDMDWMKGDTIIAYFDSLAAKDTTHSPAIRRLVAIDNSSAFYNVASNDTTICTPAINYSKGQRITVTFGDKGVKTVNVIGETQGVLAEPDAADTLNTTACGKPPAKKPAGKTPEPARKSGRGGAPAAPIPDPRR